MKKKKIIITVHGLKNQPPSWLLKFWWKRAVREGLFNINKKKIFIKFKMAYWADVLYPAPLIPYFPGEKSPRYLDEPYVKGVKISRGSLIKKIKLKLLNRAESAIDSIFFGKHKLINLDSLFDELIKHLFRDLDIYYNLEPAGNEASVKSKIRGRLARLLKRYRNYDILLIAHSMGSIIAYDTLRELSTGNDINTLVTIGSPLGLPYVIKKILMNDKLKYEEGMLLPCPENIRKAWYNFSDPDDKVSIIYRLGKNYKNNTRGIGPVDITVENNYIYNKNRNPHKAYGYLRTPELAEIISKFLMKAE
jgi:hypothetical protein